MGRNAALGTSNIAQIAFGLLMKNGLRLMASPEFTNSKRYFYEAFEHLNNNQGSKALDSYTKSIDSHPSPSAFVNRAEIYSKREQHYDACNDLIRARECNKLMNGDIADVIETRLLHAEMVTRNIRNGNQDSLIATIKEMGEYEFSKGILETANSIPSMNLAVLHYYFFKKLDEMKKYDEVSDYPEVEEFLEDYPSSFIAMKSNVPSVSPASTHFSLHISQFLSVLQREDIVTLQRNLLYRIHNLMLEHDYGPLSGTYGSLEGGKIRDLGVFLNE